MNLAKSGVVVGILFLLVTTIQCVDSGSAAADYMGEFRLKLIDAAYGFQELNVVIRRIEIHRKDFGADVGWRMVSSEVHTYDILQLRNGVSVNLVLESVPIGKYDKIRITFSEGYIMKDGYRRSLLLDPKIVNGFIQQFEFEIFENETYQLTFDFDVGRSVTYLGNNQYSLYPVFRVQPSLEAGAIAGSIRSPEGNAIFANIYTFTGIDSVSTSNDTTNNNGSFQITDIPTGVYSILIVPSVGTYADTLIENIIVEAQKITQLGSITLSHK